MKKQKSGEMCVLRQERFSSDNRDLGKTNAVPRSTEFDLSPAPRVADGWRDSELTFKSPKPGNCVRKDGRA